MRAQWGGELRFCLHSEPRSLNPALADDDASETVRYLTAACCCASIASISKLEPELATSWKIEGGGKSDRLPVAAGRDVFRRHSLYRRGRGVYHAGADGPEPAFGDRRRVPIGQRGGQRGRAREVRGRGDFPEPVAGVARLFDQVAIVSKSSPLKERAVLGPFRIAEHKPGAYLLLARNPNYWKTEGGRRLPYLDGVRLEILQNRELELMRFRQGQIHFISALDPDLFEQIAAQDRTRARDVGPSLEGEMMWFNMNPSRRPSRRQERPGSGRAISGGRSRTRSGGTISAGWYITGMRRPGIGPFSPANLFWFNQSLRSRTHSILPRRSELLAADGFRPGRPRPVRSRRAIRWSSR